MGSKVKLQAGLDEEGAEEEDEDTALEARRQWGANKRAYHGADEVCSEHKSCHKPLAYTRFRAPSYCISVLHPGPPPHWHTLSAHTQYHCLILRHQLSDLAFCEPPF